MEKKNKKYDDNIISALNQLPIPLITFDGNKVCFVENKRGETIFEHIANKIHRFHVSDIALITQILKDPNSLQGDKKKSVFRNYIGKRTKRNEKTKYIKIVTRTIGKGKEVFVSIYLIKKNVEKR